MELLFEVFECNLSDSSLDFSLQRFFVCQSRSPGFCFECVRNGTWSAALVSFEISQLIRSKDVIIEYRVRAAFLRNLLTQCLPVHASELVASFDN